MTAAIFDPQATSIPVLRYLVALDEARHFGRAAAAAQVSQPTLSGAIAQFERRLRTEVFSRTPHGVEPTAIGERVIAAARAALAAVQAVESAASARPPFYGPVRLGVIPTVGPYALPFVTRALEQAFPELELPIREATTAELVTALDAGRIDVALFAELPGMNERLALAPLYDEPFLAALPHDHPLARRPRVTADDLARERLLLLDEGHCLREQALALCRRRPAMATGADYRATSLETLRQIVAAGGGVTVLPALATGEADRRLALRPLPDAERRIVLAWRNDDRRAEAFATLAAPIRRRVPRDRVRPA